MNRGRHRKKPNDGYPLEINRLQYPEIFKKCFTPEQVRLLLERQANAGNPSDLTVFERIFSASRYEDGFDWDRTPENWNYWNIILSTYFIIEKKTI